jgi:hypothetical protein
MNLIQTRNSVTLEKRPNSFVHIVVSTNLRDYRSQQLGEPLMHLKKDREKALL